MQIVPATSAHAKALSEFSAQAFYDAYAYANTPEDMQQYMNENFTEEEIQKEINAKHTFIFLAMENETILGYVKLGTATSPEQLQGKRAIEIERFYVDKKLQSKKIGAALMKFLLDFAKEQGKQIVWLGVWKRNPRAVAFYEREGFRKAGEIPFTLGRDLQTDFLMVREISQ
jgi:ribosomal protein S18 acetylase RimI-like enzyme